MKASSNFVILCVVVICFSYLGGAPPPVHAGEPTNAVKGTVEKVLDIVRNKELKKPQKTAERRALLRKAVDERFDYEEMSKRTLGMHWQKRTPEERKEFVTLFSDLLERSYVNKIESYSDEPIEYLQETIEGEYALVKTKITTKGNTEVPIDYKLLRKGGQWEAYDVVIEGISLVNNYRSQFNRIIRTQSYEELVKRLRNKQEQALFEKK
jgi:phospholipid transport system substrate-binding protein